MPSVKKNNHIYLSISKTVEDYGYFQKKNDIGFEIYTNINREYRLTSSENISREKLFFSQDPCEYVSELGVEATIGQRKFEYIVCCYETYQMTDLTKIDPVPLFIRKQLKLNESLAFSICDFGSLSPLKAIEWAQMTKKNVLLVCLEQVMSPAERSLAEHFPKADACALAAVGPNDGDFLLTATKYKRLSPKQNNELTICNSFDHFLAQEACKLIDSFLDFHHIHPHEVSIIPHSISSSYIDQFKSYYPHVLTKEKKYNLSTADPFYTLSERIAQRGPLQKNILLNYADQRGVGLILLSNHKPVY